MTRRVTPAEAAQIISDVRATYTRIDERMRMRANAWRSRILAYRGFTWQTKRGFGAGSVDDEDEIRISLNRIRGIVRASASQLVKNIAAPIVRPWSNDLGDRAKAAAAERLLNGILRIRKAHLVALETALWAEICGAGFIKIYWNPMTGRRIETPVYKLDRPGSTEGGTYGKPDPHEGKYESAARGDRPADFEGEMSAQVPEEPIAQTASAEREQVTDTFGEPLFETTFEGDISYGFTDSYSLLVDSAAGRWQDVRHVIHRRVMPRGDLLELYPVDIFGKPTRDKLSAPASERGRETNLASDNDPFRDTRNDREDPELCEYWEAPSRDFQHGRLITWSGDALLHYGPNPYRPARLPFVMVGGESRVPGTLYPDGIVHDLEPLQKALNYAASKQIEWERMCATYRLLVPNEAEVDDAQLTDRMADIVNYRHPYRPEHMSPPPLSPSVVAMVDNFSNAMQSVSGMSPLAFGETPVGAESGRAMSLLGEKDATFRSIDYAFYADAWADLCSQTLALARQFYEEGRMVQVIGENNRWEVIAIRRDDFMPTYDIHIEPFGPAQIRSQRISELLESFDRGILGSPQDPRVQRSMRRALELDYAGAHPYDDEEVDRSKAREEQLLTMEFEKYGLPAIDVRPYQDHAVHIEEHTRWMKSHEFDALPPPLQQWFIETHVAAHEQTQLAQNQAMQAQLAGGQAGGAQPGAGTPASPQGLDGQPPGPEVGGGGGMSSNAESPSPTAQAAAHELTSDVSRTKQAAAQFYSGGNGAQQ